MYSPSTIHRILWLTIFFCAGCNKSLYIFYENSWNISAFDLPKCITRSENSFILLKFCYLSIVFISDSPNIHTKNITLLSAKRFNLRETTLFWEFWYIWVINRHAINYAKQVMNSNLLKHLFLFASDAQLTKTHGLP